MILPYHFKSFPFRLLFSVAVLNAIGILHTLCELV